MKKRLTLLFIFVVTISQQSIAGSKQNEESKFSVNTMESFAKSVEDYAANEGANHLK